MIRETLVNGDPCSTWTPSRNLAARSNAAVYVVASGDVLAEQGLTDTEHSTRRDIVDGADGRDDTWRAEGGS